MVAWAPLLGAAGSLVSGLFGGSKSKNVGPSPQEMDMWQQEQLKGDAIRFLEYNIDDRRRAEDQAFAREQADTSWSRTSAAADLAYNRQVGLDNTRVQRLVADAKVAGIHPLAALGANLSSPIVQAPQAFGGSASYSGSSSTGYRGSPAPTGHVVQEQGWGDAVGNALSALSVALPTERQILENKLLKAQINQIGVENAVSIADARSRTLISAARGAATGGRGSVASAMSGGASDRTMRTVLGNFTLPPGVSKGSHMEDIGGDNLITDILTGSNVGTAVLNEVLRQLRSPSPGEASVKIPIVKIKPSESRPRSSTIDMMLGGMDKFR